MSSRIRVRLKVLASSFAKCTLTALVAAVFVVFMVWGALANALHDADADKS